jgi:divalent metal cation (Fe/Co/Zn/Cd) transporter
MKTIPLGLSKEKSSLYGLASVLALITIIYNIIEGMVSLYFGFDDETIALFGFGLDSFVEVISGIGIWHMINRLKSNEGNNSDRFEIRALKITGTAFYILTVGLVLTSILNIYQGHKPETTFWGIIVASLSIFTMWILIHYKLKVGNQLNSKAIIADANCTKACLYLSVILLLSSAGYELTGIGGLDSLGAIFIAGFSFREGRESFQKAKGNMPCSCKDHCIESKA